MAPPRMRPRFVLQLPVERERWLAALRSLLNGKSPSLHGQVFSRHAVVQMRDGERTFWSPYLNLEVDDEPDGSAIRGRFSPHPNVWTLFMGIYMLLSIAGLAGFSYGIVQLTLHEPPWAFLFVPLSIAIIGFVYGATLIGQGLGAEQMYRMRSLVDQACVDSLADPLGRSSME